MFWALRETREWTELVCVNSPHAGQARTSSCSSDSCKPFTLSVACVRFGSRDRIRRYNVKLVKSLVPTDARTSLFRLRETRERSLHEWRKPRRCRLMNESFIWIGSFEWFSPPDSRKRVCGSKGCTNKQLNMVIVGKNNYKLYNLLALFGAVEFFFK